MRDQRPVYLGLVYLKMGAKFEKKISLDQAYAAGVDLTEVTLNDPELVNEILNKSSNTTGKT